MSGVLRVTLQRSHDHGFDAGIVNRARRAGARLVVQPGHALPHKTPPPLAYGLPVQPGRHFRVLTTTFRTGHHYPGSQSQCLRRLPPHRQRGQFGALLIGSISGGQVAGPPLEPPSLFASILGTATRIYCESMIANLLLGTLESCSREKIVGNIPGFDSHRRRCSGGRGFRFPKRTIAFSSPVGTMVIAEAS